ncbi:MAG: flagellar basal body rod protein FlgC [Verrucomicrobiota bacterium]
MPALDSTASALQAEKTRLDIIGMNIANANTTRGPDGQPYSRQMVSFEAALLDAGTTIDGEKIQIQGVKIRDIQSDQTPGPLIFNPGHPDADDQGMVRLPNVNLTHEMVDMITASRSYEANLQVVKTAKQMAEQAIMISKK